MPCQYGFFF
ncbi:hypothetical protein VCCP1050_2425, partial [Vibrio cholerae CP1050(23)]